MLAPTYPFPSSVNSPHHDSPRESTAPITRSRTREYSRNPLSQLQKARVFLPAFLEHPPFPSGATSALRGVPHQLVLDGRRVFANLAVEDADGCLASDCDGRELLSRDTAVKWLEPARRNHYAKRQFN